MGYLIIHVKKQDGGIHELRDVVPGPPGVPHGESQDRRIGEIHGWIVRHLWDKSFDIQIFVAETALDGDLRARKTA